jgi:PAS domain S-box-containing protein
LLVNKRFEELFNVKNEEVRGKTDFDIHDRDLADQFRANDLRVLSQKRSCQVEEQVPQGDGVHTYLAVKFPIYDELGEPTGVGSIATDITAAKKAQDRLRRLSASIMSSQENERALIARELHDELGQTLTALNMDAVWLVRRLGESDPPASSRAEGMRSLIDGTINVVRGMALRLRPKVLDDLGLVDALEWLTGDFEKRTEINCLFNFDDVPVIHGPVATAAYRIAQEALTNVARHSLANQVHLELSAQEGALSLEIEDNGRGFNALDLSEFSGLGIAGMRERAVLVGGILNVRSRPGQGTRIEFKVPLNGKESFST